ncbi:TerB family tellurite resistance protein [Chitinophaga sp. 2R12]|uniref:TerB family tellurite resistance protein n=1 Tax=Chitinophaga hostae TaxID=2831022 RepID=A0ABS5IXY0_9BACT|nr:TerB family tellurite resistance protein [Chitinophaga hostae]
MVCWVLAGGLFFTVFFAPYRVNAQAKEIAQLALNIEKLAQFRQILSDLKKGYEILSGGYNTIKNISQGNFQLHKLFLDGLMEVNPAIKKYSRVADIIDDQVSIVKEYKKAFQYAKSSGIFTVGEIEYMGRVYSRLFDGSLQNLDDLITVITASNLRMSDEERLSAIDKVYSEMEDKLVFLRQFNSSNSVMALQRMKEQKEVDRMKAIEGLK